MLQIPTINFSRLQWSRTLWCKLRWLLDTHRWGWTTLTSVATLVTTTCLSLKLEMTQDWAWAQIIQKILQVHPKLQLATRIKDWWRNLGSSTVQTLTPYRTPVSAALKSKQWFLKSSSPILTHLRPSWKEMKGIFHLVLSAASSTILRIHH